MAIPREFIHDLLSRTNIVELIEPHVSLKKAGKNYHACCPFHNEKTPSFTVSPDKQFYHCFGCGEHGNAIDFVMNFERLEFVEALEELAQMHGLSLPKNQHASQKFEPQVDHLYPLCTLACDHFQRNLWQHPERSHAVAYLKARGLSPAIAKKFRLGMARQSWDDLKNQKPEQSHALEQAGLLIRKDQGSGYYDRFRHRLMFPIRDRRGRTVGFGGRVFDDSKPKYLNSPETPIFHKGQELYGLYEVKQAYKNIPQILIVEGYMDVVSLAQYDINYAVASLGTSTTAEHIQLLFRNSAEVICCYDGDTAGQDAAWRTLETALPYLKAGRSLKFMFLPESQDPDTYVREFGREAFEAEVKQAATLGEFLFEHLSLKHQVEDGSLAKEALARIQKVSDPILQETLQDQLAYQLRLNNAQELKKKFNLGQPTQSANPSNTPAGSRQSFTVRLSAALLVQQPEIGFELPEQQMLRELPYPGIKLLQKLLDLTRNERLTTGILLEAFRDYPKQYQALKSLSTWPTGIQACDSALEFKQNLIWFTNQYLESKFNLLNQKKALTKDERYQLQDLLQILQK